MRLGAQRATISAAAIPRGWSVEWIEDPGYSAKDMKRPGIQAALGMLREGKADTLVVSRLDRLSRSMLDFTSLLAVAQAEGWAVVALDIAMDTTTAEGEMMALIRATFAQYERRLTSQRTRETLAQRRAAGHRLGRERVISSHVEQRARQLHRTMLIRKVAAAREAEGFTTPGGRPCGSRPRCVAC